MQQRRVVQYALFASRTDPTQLSSRFITGYVGGKLGSGLCDGMLEGYYVVRSQVQRDAFVDVIDPSASPSTPQKRKASVDTPTTPPPVKTPHSSQAGSQHEVPVAVGGAEDDGC